MAALGRFPGEFRPSIQMSFCVNCFVATLCRQTVRQNVAVRRGVLTACRPSITVLNMFDSVCGRRHLLDSRLGAGALVSLATHGAIVGVIAWGSMRGMVTDEPSKPDPIVRFWPGTRASAGEPPSSAGTRRSFEPRPATQGARRTGVPRNWRGARAKTKLDSSDQMVGPGDTDVVGAPDGIGSAASGPGGGKDGPPGSGGPIARTVPGFVFDRELLFAPDPHLPSAIRESHPHEQLRGLYRICIGRDGRVQHVSVLSSIAGADEAIMGQIRSAWRYKPQPVPVCSTRGFVFTIN